MMAVFPRPEEAERAYGKTRCNFEFDVEMISPISETESPVAISEAMLSDIIVCLTGPSGVWTMGFTVGSDGLEADVEILGDASDATATVQAVTLESGSLSTGNAVGTLILIDVEGEFLANESLRVGGQIVAASSGLAMLSTPAALVGAEDIIYSRGGTDRYPEPGESTVGTQVTFNVKYITVAGDPYSRPEV